MLHQAASRSAVGRFAARVAGLDGWRRRLAAAAAGALATAALPPVHLVPLLAVAFPVLVWLVRASRSRAQAFAVGWWFGLGFHVAGLYWVSVALLVEPERFAWLIPFAVLGLSAGFAIYAGLAALLAYWAAARAGFGALALALAASWTLLDYLRQFLLSGFPWNLMATAWTAHDWLIQGGALIGPYGLGLAAVAAAAMPAALARPGRARWALASGLIVAVLAAGGAWRLMDAADQSVPDVRLRLVQPSIDQRLKWRPELRGGHVARQIAMSQGPWRPADRMGADTISQVTAGQADGAGPTHVIWGETALPFLLEREPLLQQALGRLVPPGGAVITGAPRASDLTDSAQLYNSIQVVDASGRIVATYDKVHLVPFGEYVPLRGWLPIEKIAHGQRDFSAGVALQTLSLPGLPPASPLICYEVIFPGAVALRDRRPAWLLNLTNDAWFGRTSGPYQHFAAARLRAVEEGLPVVRVANTGISAVIDGFGRTRARLGLGVDGVLDARLPAALPATPYVLWGDAPALVVCLLILLASGLVSRRVALPHAEDDNAG